MADRYTRHLIPMALATCLMPLGVWAQEQTNRVPAGQNYVTVLGVPSATVAPSGLAFAQVNAAYDLGGSATGDTTGLTFGIGLGDAETGLGFQVTGSYGFASDTFGDYALFGMKAARRITIGDAPTYVALTVDRLAGTGAANGADPAASAILTRFYTLTDRSGETYPLMTSVGIGTEVADLFTEVGAFAGIGIGLTEGLGVSAAWNGSYIDIGAAFRFDTLENVGFSVTLSDAFDSEDRQQIQLSASWYFNTWAGR